MENTEELKNKAEQKPRKKRGPNKPKEELIECTIIIPIWGYSKGEKVKLNKEKYEFARLRGRVK